MKGFVQNIEDLAVKNDELRRVLYTARHCQLVLMALQPKEEIGAEVHELDQFFRVEQGAGEAVLDGVRTGTHHRHLDAQYVDELRQLVKTRAPQGYEVAPFGVRVLNSDFPNLSSSTVVFVAGFQPIMPPYEGQIGEEHLLELIAYIKSLKNPEDGASL